MAEGAKSFWDHLDELRSVLIRIIVVSVLSAIVVFAFKVEVFGFILAPAHSDFVTYGLLDKVSGETSNFNLQMINTQLAAQFSVHVKMSVVIGMIVVSPYILYMLFVFVSPALYSNERRATRIYSIFGYVMFMLGVALSYYMIFPLTIRFLGDYHVSETIENVITLESYIDVLVLLTLAMGIVFELPLLCLLFAKIGLLTSAFMKEHRRHAFVLLLVVSAVITPTGDAFTLLVVSLPIYLLYEMSVWLVKLVNK